MSIVRSAIVRGRLVNLAIDLVDGALARSEHALTSILQLVLATSDGILRAVHARCNRILRAVDSVGRPIFRALDRVSGAIRVVPRVVLRLSDAVCRLVLGLVQA